MVQYRRTQADAPVHACIAMPCLLNMLLRVRSMQCLALSTVSVYAQWRTCCTCCIQCCLRMTYCPCCTAVVWQAAFLLLLLPLSCRLKGLSLAELPVYLKAGTTCLLGGSPTCGANCQGAPLLPFLYIGVNVAFNVAAMYLVRSTGAVAAALAMSCLVPLTVLAFTLPLPLLEPVQLGPGFVWGAVLLTAGLLLYNARLWVPVVLDKGQRWQQQLSGS
eukprot:GHRR01012667.1.p1 GENE.GHRR01012667.1~~GHRR01012667.1.p1  ORF type:complete len:218 (-),score=37.46 GHRR01012667.1:545-1198(-)